MITAAFVSLLLQIGSAPYERSRVASTGHCLWWPAGMVTYHQDQSGDPLAGDAAFAGVSRAFQSWQQVMDQCGSLTLAEGPRVTDRMIGYDTDNPASNENVVLFRMQSCDAAAPAGDPCITAGACGNTYDCWEHDRNIIALTTTTYSVSTGTIVDSDVELNAAYFYFTTVDSPPCTALPYDQSCVAYDVQNTMTHEAGHFLGLDHTSYPSSIMTPNAPPGDLSKRTIDPESRRFVCDTYPKGSPAQDCITAHQGCGATGGALETWACGAALVALALRRQHSHRGNTCDRRYYWRSSSSPR